VLQTCAAAIPGCEDTVSESEVPMNESGSNDQRAVNFRTTHWSVVLEAGTAPQGARAMETLCRTYWYPLYAFVRRRGHRDQEAQDLTQEFFMRLLDGETLRSVHPTKGRFRGFLVAAMRHFLANQWRNAHRLKRGGDRWFLSWEELKPEERYGLEPEIEGSPEAIYDRAQTLAAYALNCLRSEMESEGNGARFEALRGYLEADAAPSTYADMAAQLRLSEPALKSAIHRLRRRYAEFVRQEIAHTVNSPDEVEEEIRRLIELLAA
jgi:RNA polymerase sigma factor (sigma-70 family)